MEAEPGTTLAEAARQAGIEIHMPCGGQGRCGRCAVIVEEGLVQRRSTLGLSAQEVAQGYALACQTVLRGDATIQVPPQEALRRRPSAGESRVREMEVPFPYDPAHDQAIRRLFVELPPPSFEDNLDDFGRLEREVARKHGLAGLRLGLPLARRMGSILRQADWKATAVLEAGTWLSPEGAPRLIDLLPDDATGQSWGLAVDIGTTSNVVYLVDLISGKVVDAAAEYNAQVRRGEDVISRIIYAKGEGGLEELQGLVVGTINGLIRELAERQHINPNGIHKMTVAGNTIMIHLFLGIPPEPIRLTPYIPPLNYPQPVLAQELGLGIHPQATVDCLPGVGSYVGADITAGALSSGLYKAEKLTLFVDIGTNGEMVLGSAEWLISCACSAGPAFEGAGVAHGMRATQGAIEELWIDGSTYEPTYRTIANHPPLGICGSGLISLIAEMLITGIVDRSGNIRLDLDTPRVRQGEHGPEYVVAWAKETAQGKDISISDVDIASFIRAKAAVRAGLAVLTLSLGLDLSMVEEFLIAGAFGQHLNIEKAVQIGLLPDLPWERFRFLGNTSARGAYWALLSREMRQKVQEIAWKMTYLELSADNRFHEAYLAALFLPHTNIEEYPTVKKLLSQTS